jgi:AraC-like DNA-binding protein
MDILTYLLSHFSLKAGVFYTGPICGVHDFEEDTTQGHVHLIHRGLVKISGPNIPSAIVINEPTVLFMPRPDKHRLEISEGEEIQALCGTIHFGYSQKNPISDSLPAILAAPLSALTNGVQVTDLLFSEAFEQPEGRQGTLDRLCEILIMKLLRHGMAEGLIHGGVLAGLLDTKLSKALLEIHEHPARAWTVANMADAAGMSRSRFAEHFNRVLGESPADYLTSWRIITAQQLIRQGMQIKQVCGEVGYGSASAFNRAFSRKVGCSPSQWLKQHTDL